VNRLARRLRAWSDRIDRSIWGDAIGLVSIGITLWAGLLAAHVWGG